MSCALLISAACSAAPAPSTSQSAAVRSPTASVERKLAIEQTAAFRTQCATDVLRAFVDAFDNGDDSAMSFFSATDGVHPFEWFVTPETPAYGPPLPSLGAYFAAWHAAGERWRIVSVTSGEGPSWHGGVDFAMRIERTSPRGSVTEDGKGALDCNARKIFVFGLGAPVAR